MTPAQPFSRRSRHSCEGGSGPRDAGARRCSCEGEQGGRGHWGEGGNRGITAGGKGNEKSHDAKDNKRKAASTGVSGLIMRAAVVAMDLEAITGDGVWIRWGAIGTRLGREWRKKDAEEMGRQVLQQEGTNTIAEQAQGRTKRAARCRATCWLKKCHDERIISSVVAAPATSEA